MNTEIIWNNFLEKIKERISPLSYDTWFKDTKLYKLDKNTAIIIVPMILHKKHLEENYLDEIEEIFNSITGTNFNFQFKLENEITEDTLEEKIIDETESIGVPHQTSSSANLNSEYTFDSFIVGDSNRFAFTAARAVAEKPGKAYNPLFLYGKSGLGKTHLMHAIGNEVAKRHKDFKILYVTSENFMNEFINSLIKDNGMENFRNKYRNIDLLLIDDIQFIAGKDRLQEEFFNTFNDLREHGKQIILSSDKLPRDIPLLEDRLKSRFEWGILADISMADYEVRLAILRKKAEEKHAIIDDDILKNIAAKIDSNIRELEGVFNKIVAQASLTHTPVTFEMAEKAINDVVTQKEKVLSIELIQETISKYFNITVNDLKGIKRSADVTFPRQIAMYLCRSVAGQPLTVIGAKFGKRDHTTVLHACNKIENEVKENPSTKRIVDSVKNLLTSDK